jgi:hypothetical protein
MSFVGNIEAMCCKGSVQFMRLLGFFDDVYMILKYIKYILFLL